ncbi:FAD-dependent thymidylate synthase [Moraxella bovis]|uniref:FAD-dependent thymidylate synthase n=1 Tax=Moraxella bovis TaxID=476 RepID=UPI002225F018|nr:FAD-dependent thymidylate synthase [Moraxella bovis]UZA57343.1 FAD-dependent thymidylate synthase [Moraxella bovis]
MIKATVIADSISAHTGTRITTLELEYPRFILAELNTHRMFSRNTASSRAIPIDKMIELVETNPATPIHWGLNQSGMQAKHEQANPIVATNTWLEASNDAIKHARKLQALGLHKQIVNRVLEPFQIVKTLVTATNYDNFFHLRLHKDAQPEIQQLAYVMYEAMKKSKPVQLNQGEWHTPYYGNGYWNEHCDNDLETALMISCSCSAQVSYRKNDTSIEKAIKIYDKLIGSEPKHASAFEHCATPIDVEEEFNGGLSNEVSHGITGITFGNENQGNAMDSGNFTNWIQYRQLIPNHDCKEFNYET